MDVDADERRLQEEVIELDDDPFAARLFATRAEVFEAANSRAVEALDDSDDDDNPEPSFLDDDPAVRAAYIRCYIAGAFQGATRPVVHSMLEASYALLSSASRRSGLEFQGLEKFARTQRTLERRLGVNTDDIIQVFYICNICWRMHNHEQVLNMDSPACTNDDCEGKVYTLKRMQDGSEKRTPIKIVSYVSPVTAIKLMLARRGKYDQLQHWRREGDEPGPGPPSTDRGESLQLDPDRPMTDIYDGWGWRAIQAGLVRQQRGEWDLPEDVDVDNIKQSFTKLDAGLVFQKNTDWFQSIKGSYSTGAIYLSCLNNPRSVRYLREETPLIYVLPGPHEPNTEQLNEVCKPFVGDFLELGKVVHGIVDHEVSDLPAIRKVQGLASCTSKLFMCPEDTTESFALVDPSAFDPSKYTPRSDLRYRKYAFHYATADAEHQEAIFDRRGVRWSIFNLWPGWMAAGSAPKDYMHGMFLGACKHVTRTILYSSGMFNGINARSTRQPLSIVNDTFDSIWWPPSVGRVPKNLVSTGSGKADEWRSLMSVLFIAVFAAWNVDGAIPDADAPQSATNTNAAKSQKATHARLRARRVEFLEARVENPTEEDYEEAHSKKTSRNYREHYDALLKFTVAVRILSAESISVNDVERGTQLLCEAFQQWAAMGCSLTPYCHLMTHIKSQYLRLGPIAYTTAAWAYERNNGDLKKVHHNGHTGGELEATMMRAWWKRVRIVDLINNLESLPRPWTAEDVESIELLHRCMKGDMKASRGTLETYMDRYNAAANATPRVELPRQSQEVQLRNFGISEGQPLYGLTLQLLRDLWAPHMNIVADVSMAADATRYHGRARTFTNVIVGRRRFGVSTRSRGIAACYGYIDIRIPIRIDYLITTSQTAPDGTICTANIAFIRRFARRADDMMRDVDWAFWATDLGTEIWHAGELGELEAVAMERLSGQFEGQEPDVFDDDG
ncbi:hypothetical protein FA95DRAFT_1583620 [Auriscalpium vulgare]|uniref:Uncharacterized protein n=1 Tax=Auriscalpium vulgare TaxID=40419 RepID=A0ACB8RM67_9AGAM|nr:hypothetical protein FA95DRAFT_1583620 [Auriscalpium vulgare]